IDFINLRSIGSLFQPLPSPEPSDNSELIDSIQINEDPDTIFQIEVMNSLSSLEQSIALMLIDGYSVIDVLRHYKMSKRSLKEILKKILSSCGRDCTTKGHGNEGWLMELDRLDLEPNEFENSTRAKLELVHIDRVLPNPKNPRKDPAINTKQMQEIIKTNGWEEPITCYQSGHNYIILSGHRRWYAAKQIGETMIPLYIVEAPKSDSEELDRIGSVQGGQVEWSQYELVKYTYDRWISSGKKPINILCKELRITEGLAKSQIRVYQYYPQGEIEEKLTNRMYSLTMLDYILTWIKRLKKYHPDIVDSLGEHYIRRLMLKKYENRCFNSQLTHDRTFVIHASSQAITEFLTDANKKLYDCQIELAYISAENCNPTQIISDIQAIQVEVKVDAVELLHELEKLMIRIEEKKMYLDNNYKLVR
ncbi:hypothetical protein E4V51_15510, partial [Paenibacillus sp. 28ISP30-2]|nr:hypothetical protein [Paenibacillus sp. 28ISP30-2]